MAKFTIRQLGYIEAAAKYQSMAMAAKMSQISQSSIAGAIDDFESTFSVQLFVRHPSKGLDLTPSGRALIERMSRLLRQIDAFNTELNGLSEQVAGQLNLGCFAPLAPLILPPILRALNIRYPELTIRVIEGDLLYVNGLLNAGKVDVILTYDLGLPEGVAFEKLRQLNPHVILCESHPLAKRKTISISDIVSEPMILLDLPESRTYFDLIFKTFDVVPRVVYRTGTYETVRSFVAEGLGYALLNLRPVLDHAYTGKKVVCIPIADNVPASTVGIGTRPNDYLSRATHEFINECRSFFATEYLNKISVS